MIILKMYLTVTRKRFTFQQRLKVLHENSLPVITILKTTNAFPYFEASSEFNYK